MRLYAGKIEYRLAAERQPNVRFVFTGNATVKSGGALVMGRGAAREVRDLFPGIDLAFGRLIRSHTFGANAPYMHYGMLWAQAPQEPWPEIGVFQVKHHFMEEAQLDLIDYSARHLGHLAAANPHMTYFMNYPGIGNGRLTRPMVEPILSSHLPDNVVLYVM